MTKQDAIDRCNKATDICRELKALDNSVEIDLKLTELWSELDEIHDFIQDNVGDYDERG